MRFWNLTFVALLLCHQFFETAQCANPLADTGFISSLPRGVSYLNDANFDSNVFPINGKLEPWVIIFYSPSCSHCKKLIPELIEAARMVGNVSSAKIGLVNSKKGDLARRYNIKMYPDVYYTVGRNIENLSIFPYANAITAYSLLRFSIFLFSVSSDTSAAVDVTAPVKFSSLAENDETPSFFFYRSNVSRGTDWVGIVDSVLSIGRANFFVLNEGNLPPRDQMSEKYQSVVDTAQKCSNAYSCLGPNGVVLVSNNDRFTSPRCYCGLWSAENHAEVNPRLKLFFVQNSRKSVERFDSQFFFSLEEEGENYLAILIFNNKEDDLSDGHQAVSTIRDMVQVSNEKLRSESPSLDEEMTAPRIIWTYTDTLTNVAWLQSYGVNFSNLPEVLIIDISRNRFFRASKLLPAFDSVKRMKPWLPGGVQSQILTQFSLAITSGKLRAEKNGFVGYAAEYLSQVPGLGRFYQLIGYEDTVFVSGTVALFFLVSAFLFLLRMLFQSKDSSLKFAAEKLQKKNQ